MRRLFNAIVAVLFVAGCSEAPLQPESPVSGLETQLTERSSQSRADADTQHDNARFTFPFEIVACNGEDIAGTATAHVVSHSTVSASGQVSVKSHGNFKAKGTGQATGAEYEVNQVVNESFSFDINEAPFTHTSRLVVRVIGQGVVPDRRIDGQVIQTVNADGEVTNWRMKFSSTCS